MSHHTRAARERKLARDLANIRRENAEFEAMMRQINERDEASVDRARGLEDRGLSQDRRQQAGTSTLGAASQRQQRDPRSAAGRPIVRGPTTRVHGIVRGPTTRVYGRGPVQPFEEPHLSTGRPPHGSRTTGNRLGQPSGGLTSDEVAAAAVRFSESPATHFAHWLTDYAPFLAESAMGSPRALLAETAGGYGLGQAMGDDRDPWEWFREDVLGVGAWEREMQRITDRYAAAIATALAMRLTDFVGRPPRGMTGSRLARWVGREGERLARRFLRSQGYIVFKLADASDRGIDILAFKPAPGGTHLRVYHFEVKSSAGSTPHPPRADQLRTREWIISRLERSMTHLSGRKRRAAQKVLRHLRDGGRVGSAFIEITNIFSRRPRGHVNGRAIDLHIRRAAAGADDLAPPRPADLDPNRRSSPLRRLP